MSAAGNHIPEKGNLYRIKETIEAIRDDVDANKAERADFVAKFDDMKEALDGFEARVNRLDEALPKGDKVYVPAGDGSRASAVNLFGRAFTAARRAANGDDISDTPFERAGQTEGTASAGGILVPTEVHNEVVRLIDEKSFARQLCRVIPMVRDKMDIGTVSSGPSIEWPGEASDATDDVSVVTFGTPSLDSETMVALDSVSRELREDQLIAIEPFLAELFAERMGKEENLQCFSSTSPFSGVVQTAGYSTVIAGTDFSTVSYANLVSAKFNVDATVIGSGQWVMHPAVFQHVVNLRDDQNRPIWASFNGSGITNDVSGGSAGSIGTLLGSPVYLTTQMPGTSSSGLKFAIYGDFKYRAFGDRRGITVEFDDSVYFKARKRAIMVSERIAQTTLIANAFNCLETA